MRTRIVIAVVGGCGFIFLVAVAIAVLLFATKSSTDGVSLDQGLGAHEKIEQRVQERLTVEDRRLQEHLNLIKANHHAAQPVTVNVPAPVVTVVQQPAQSQSQSQQQSERQPATGLGRDLEKFRREQQAERTAEADTSQPQQNGGSFHVVVEQRESLKQIALREGIRAAGKIGAARAGRPDFGNDRFRDRRDYGRGYYGNGAAYDNHAQYVALQRRLRD